MKRPQTLKVEHSSDCPQRCQISPTAIRALVHWHPSIAGAGQPWSARVARQSRSRIAFISMQICIGTSGGGHGKFTRDRE